MSAIAIIIARGGSKRIPRKNIREFCGSPIIRYSIEAAISSKCFDEIMVSTDDEEISRIAKSYGAKTPFTRSEKNSDDYATTADVLIEVIDRYKAIGKEFDNLCCIYPTAPFVSAGKLISAMEILQNNNDCDCVLPVVKYSYPIQRSLKIENQRLKMNWPENYSTRSQDLGDTYHDAGQFYCAKIADFLESKVLFTPETMPVIVSELEVQDIDSEEDWKIAEMKYKILNNG